LLDGSGPIGRPVENLVAPEVFSGEPRLQKSGVGVGSSADWQSLESSRDGGAVPVGAKRSSAFADDLRDHEGESVRAALTCDPENVGHPMPCRSPCDGTDEGSRFFAD